MNSKHGTLFVVATPIGNRDDLSPRARQVLGAVDLIAAEDTRRTGRLLSHFGIKTPQISLHEHNEERACRRVLDELLAGASVALVSDAGTPLINDPGFRLLESAHEQGLCVSPVPGPSAVVCALSVAGLPTDRFCFEGYLPARREARRAVLEELRNEPRSLVFLEAVHRVREMLADLTEIFGADRPAFVGRELTKLHEQCVRATLGRLLELLDSGEIPAKGEFVVVTAGARGASSEVAAVGVDQLLLELIPLLPGSQAVDIVSRLTGQRRNDVYRAMLALKGAVRD
ncbi:MAG: 16S rRNA (cytidine(1402)-2'-O)-methyltransferase [Gammaproteobacteria bacterium]|nr:16S rRNA (cytidine(1402)-2'-O)-methyltransferase [Gammaproteobacteria bacterium]MDH4253781.1 16S rRNA (cytidine(1402)-2'-O)-methyltransferase [Gammaproteobacteria bacterium]MDH5308646.1 16S rRNA (cytidine(1402)-2'-O)-methyltransferase [Gammaproteobacteria bacterium]